MLKLTVLVSGGGTNLQAIIDRIADGSIHGAEIVRVISNNPGVYALERAEKAGIPSQVLSPKDFASREEFNDALLAALQASGADLVVLAGCLVAIPPQVVKAYPNRIINIHPALIPSFCGKGFYGLHVHEKVLERGVKVTGATVHFVDEDLDHGKNKKSGVLGVSGVSSDFRDIEKAAAEGDEGSGVDHSSEGN